MLEGILGRWGGLWLPEGKNSDSSDSKKNVYFPYALTCSLATFVFFLFCFSPFFPLYLLQFSMLFALWYVIKFLSFLFFFLSHIFFYCCCKLKNWCFWTMVVEKTLESPLECKEIQPVHPKGDQPWVFTGRTDVEAVIPILWPPDGKSWFIWKDPDAGKDWRQEKGMTEDEMVGLHHWHNGHGFGWTLGVGDGQGGLVCCSSWGHKELDKTEGLNWTDKPLLLHWTFAILWSFPFLFCFVLFSFLFYFSTFFNCNF